MTRHILQCCPRLLLAVTSVLSLPRLSCNHFFLHISYYFIISLHLAFLSHPIYGKKMSAVEPTGFGCNLQAPKEAPEPSRGADLEQSSQPPSRAAQPHVFSSRALPESEAFGASNLMIICFFLIIKNNNELIHFSLYWFVWRTGHPEFGG